MGINRKQKLFIFLLIFSVIIGGTYFLYYSNRPKNLNVLLITIDALRPDHLGCYGYKRNTSPNIDRLAREGVLFTQAISQVPWTVGSLVSLLTSTYPSTHGVYFWDQGLPDLIPTFAQILKEKDYYSGFISGHGGLPRINEFGRGFDTFDDIFNAKADQITNKAISWIEKNKSKRFLLWIHYMDAHDKSLDISEQEHFIKNITLEKINDYVNKYDKAIGYIDSQIAALLEELTKCEIYQKTVTIITADHGQEMCEHGICFNHGGFLWDSVIKVPLIIFSPKFFSKNKIITQQVQHIDILPTICDVLKIEKSKSFEGKSLLPLIKGRNIYSPFVFSEHKENKGDLNTGDLVYTKFSIRTSEWKLIFTCIHNDQAYELYNLKTDPHELNNLVEIEKDQFEFLKAKLEEWMNRPKPDISSKTKPLDEETKKKLKSLGYLQ